MRDAAWTMVHGAWRWNMARVLLTYYILINLLGTRN